MAQIHELIGKAMMDIGPIAKTKKNREQGYNFRGIDDVYNALSPILSKYGLFVIPRVLERTREERQTAKGYRLIYTVLKIQYTMYAPDGSSVEGITEGEGMDSADKSTNKAMSAAYKYFMFQLFNIPTEEAVDADAETPPPSEPVPPQKPTPPQPNVIATPHDAAKAAAESKAKCLKKLKETAAFAFGPEKADEAVAYYLGQYNQTAETMTGEVFKKVKDEIMAIIAANANKEHVA